MNLSISPDDTLFFSWGFFEINATILYTWIIMAILFTVSWIATRKIEKGVKISRWQAAMEVIVDAIRGEIREMMGSDPDRYLPFLGSLFLFILTANLLTIMPAYEAPTGSLSTAAALAIVVFVSVPVFGITEKGLGGYLKSYIKPSPVMLPFNIISELSRTLALAVRLFGNIMSGTLIAGVLLSIAPFFVPVIMQVFGLIVGVIQAYIFTVLAAIYIASATQVQRKQEEKLKKQINEKSKEESDG
ncbi:MAG: F0F1 ATP synthase subunit A [Spirochaetia bacterium]|jgi:F-type H+-transporting ATPase subunit a|nr:F0F1 ATP synthase subunit A [Spirochaetia bacterium]